MYYDSPRMWRLTGFVFVSSFPIHPHTTNLVSFIKLLLVVLHLHNSLVHASHHVCFFFFFLSFPLVYILYFEKSLSLLCGFNLIACVLVDDSQCLLLLVCNAATLFSLSHSLPILLVTYHSFPFSEQTHPQKCLHFISHPDFFVLFRVIQWFCSFLCFCFFVIVLTFPTKCTIIFLTNPTPYVCYELSYRSCFNYYYYC
jgi:hypothetical protein